MPYDNIYQNIIDDFMITGSVKQTAQNVGTTLVRAQRILITEGLWSSPTSERIVVLWAKGKTVPEIAKELFVSEKTVQAYLPYSRNKQGYGGENRSQDAVRSEDYRIRMQRVAQAQVSSADMEKERGVMKDKNKPNNEEFRVISEGELAEARRKRKSESAARSKSTGFGEMTTEQLYHEHMEKEPSVLKLSLSLDISGLRPEDYQVLKKYGKVGNGITREVLVPADITLHALNYVILRAFGWQNSHLHSFHLPADVFQKLTGGKNKADEYGCVAHDGLYTDWVKLCGVYFRFPCDNFDDLYWDDDYEDGESIKSWFRRKYTGPYFYDGNWEHYDCANEAAKRVVTKKTIGKATLQELEMGFEGRMDELLERLPLIQLLLPQGSCEYEDLSHRLEVLQNRQEDAMEELPVIPVAHKLIYTYDYGDGWEVNIKLKDCYYTKERYDVVTERGINGYVTAILDDKAALADKEAFDRNNQLVGKALALKIATVEAKRRPICLALDGMSLMDDVGGVHGYVEFLRTIHGTDPDEKSEMREWAKWMGWTGRMNKPETLL